MAELFHSTEDLIAALARPKRLVPPSAWIMPGRNGHRGCKLKAALGDAVATIRGLRLEIGCNTKGFDLPTSLVLLAEFKNRPQTMARIDINGSRLENRRAICGELLHIENLKEVEEPQWQPRRFPL